MLSDLLPLPEQKLTSARDVENRSKPLLQFGDPRWTLIPSIDLLPNEYIPLTYVGASAINITITQWEKVLKENLHFIFRDKDTSSFARVHLLLPDQQQPLHSKHSLARFGLGESEVRTLLCQRHLEGVYGDGAYTSVPHLCVLTQWLISASVRNRLILTAHGLGYKVNECEYILIYDNHGRISLPQTIRIVLNPMPQDWTQASKTILPGCLTTFQSRKREDLIYLHLMACKDLPIEEKAFYSENFGMLLSRLLQDLYPTDETFAHLIALLNGPLKAKPVSFVIVNSAATIPVIAFVPQINAPHIPASLILILFYAYHKVKIEFMDDTTQVFINHLRTIEIESENLKTALEILLGLGERFVDVLIDAVCNEGSPIKALVDSLYQLHASLSSSDGADLMDVNKSYIAALLEVAKVKEPFELWTVPLCRQRATNRFSFLGRASLPSPPPACHESSRDLPATTGSL